ncbi:hypothetical protein ACHWQZ_G014508 [Mnemiopsis leidyi]
MTKTLIETFWCLEWHSGRRMAKQGEAKDNFNKLLAANRKAALRNNVVLLEACTYGKLNYIKTSIDAGADVHYTNEDNDTPLLRCCQLSPPEAEKCIKYLIKRGADTNHQDRYGRTTLSYIAEKGKSLIVDILISKCDADPTIEDCKGNTPLMYAVSAGSMDIIATLVGYFLVVNFPIDKRNLVGMTPLLLAAKMGRYECAKMLVEVGNANLHLRDVDTFRSAIDWIKTSCPANLEEFIALDPIVVRKRDCALRRLSTSDKTKYRVLSEFFTDGKMPSCWRNSSKGTQEPRKHQINRTICIVSDQDTIKEQEPEQTEMDETIDTILLNMSEPSPMPFSSDPVPRSMFDIPNLNEMRNCNENAGRFVERCESSMSVVSAPSPTFPRLEDPFSEEVSFLSPSLSHSQKSASVRRMERRRSIDNSLLSRPHSNSPVITSTRRVSRPVSIPNNKMGDLTTSRTRTDNARKSSGDVVRNSGDVAPRGVTSSRGVTSRDGVRNSKYTTNQMSAPKITRSGDIDVNS